MTTRYAFSLGLVFLAWMTGCTGFSGSRLGRGLSSVASKANVKADVTCGAKQVAANGKCYDIKLMDVSSSQVGVAQETYVTFKGPTYVFGIVGLRGSIAIDLDSPNVFTEELFEIGYADSCDVGTFAFTSYSDLADHLTGANFLGAQIIKTNASGHTEIPINYTLPAPIKAGGCFFVDFGADVWSQPGANPSPGITLTNNLKLKYIDAGSDLDASALSMSEALGPGGEFCVGNCDNNFNPSSQAMSAGIVVTQVTQAFTLRGIVGTISNGPFAADGRYTPSAVTGDWSTENIWYLDPQCSSSAPGYSGLLFNKPDVPANAVRLMDVSLQGSGKDSIANQFVNQSLNQSVNAGDCLVALFIGSSNSVLDMESQLAAVTDNAVVATVSSNTNQQLGARNVASTGGTATLNALASSASVTTTSTPNPAPAGPTVATGLSLPTATVYRFVTNNGKHLYALSPTAFSAARATVEGPAFSVYSVSDPSLEALYHCSEGNQYFLSGDPACEGGTPGTILGYISPQPTTTTVPLYRFDLDGDWLEVLNPSEATQAGYNDPTTLGYTPR